MGLFLACLSLAVAPLRADTIFLRNGQSIPNVTVMGVRGEVLRYRTASGSFASIPRSQVARIQYIKIDQPSTAPPPGPAPASAATPAAKPPEPLRLKTAAERAQELAARRLAFEENYRRLQAVEELLKASAAQAVGGASGMATQQRVKVPEEALTEGTPHL